jgi:beta-galactosidase/beta-glucuronidase
LDHLASGAPPRHQLKPEVWDYAKARMDAEQTNLVNRAWHFKPDPLNEGLHRGWHKTSSEEGNDWKEIRVGGWWESQGYPALDLWAWYRLSVEIPQRWAGSKVFLSFEGVDDCYELYVNGEMAGQGGDLATRKDALSEKKSYNITPFVVPGQPALIAVRVHDWYGAGGIYRPVTLGTLPFAPALDLLH